MPIGEREKEEREKKGAHIIYQHAHGGKQGLPRKGGTIIGNGRETWWVAKPACLQTRCALEQNSLWGGCVSLGTASNLMLLQSLHSQLLSLNCTAVFQRPNATQLKRSFDRVYLSLFLSMTSRFNHTKRKSVSYVKKSKGGGMGERKEGEKTRSGGFEKRALVVKRRMVCLQLQM